MWGISFLLWDMEVFLLRSSNWSCGIWFQQAVPLCLSTPNLALQSNPTTRDPPTPPRLLPTQPRFHWSRGRSFLKRVLHSGKNKGLSAASYTPENRIFSLVSLSEQRTGRSMQLKVNQSLPMFTVHSLWSVDSVINSVNSASQSTVFNSDF